jgi:hypothetical protein
MTARQLFPRCRKAGIALAVEDDQIVCKAPAGVTIPVAHLRQVKTELLAVLKGEYVAAAVALLMRIPDPQERELLAEAFDERAGICEFDGNISRGEAERAAYIQLARTVEVQQSDRARSSDGPRGDMPCAPMRMEHRSHVG